MRWAPPGARLFRAWVGEPASIESVNAVNASPPKYPVSAAGYDAEDTESRCPRDRRRIPLNICVLSVRYTALSKPRTKEVLQQPALPPALGGKKHLSSKRPRQIEASQSTQVDSCSIVREVTVAVKTQLPRPHLSLSTQALRLRNLKKFVNNLVNDVDIGG